MLKFNKVTVIIAIVLSIIIAYAFYTYSPNSIDKYALVLISFIYSVIMLLGLIAVRFEYDKTNTLIKTLSGSFLLLGILVFALIVIIWSHLPTLIISSSLLMLIYITLGYGIANSKHW